MSNDGRSRGADLDSSHADDSGNRDGEQSGSEAGSATGGSMRASDVSYGTGEMADVLPSFVDSTLPVAKQQGAGGSGGHYPGDDEV